VKSGGSISRFKGKRRSSSKISWIQVSSREMPWWITCFWTIHKHRCYWWWCSKLCRGSRISLVISRTISGLEVNNEDTTTSATEEVMVSEDRTTHNKEGLCVWCNHHLWEISNSNSNSNRWDMLALLDLKSSSQSFPSHRSSQNRSSQSSGQFSSFCRNGSSSRKLKSPSKGMS